MRGCKFTQSLEFIKLLRKFCEISRSQLVEKPFNEKLFMELNGIYLVIKKRVMKKYG